MLASLLAMILMHILMHRTRIASWMTASLDCLLLLIVLKIIPAIDNLWLPFIFFLFENASLKKSNSFRDTFLH